MKISLRMNEEVKTFVTDFLPARLLKKTIVIGTAIESNQGDDQNFDLMADYISDVFGRKFTPDQVLDGLESLELITAFTDCVSGVTGKLNDKVAELKSNNPNE